MTSGKFQYVNVADIVVDRENRQRRELTGIEELAKSIVDNGLINPIVITDNYELVAGERRLTAHKHLGFDQIAVQFMSDLSELSRHMVELEENIRRSDLTWQDHVNAVSRYHDMKTEADPSWSREKTGESLGMSETKVRSHILINKMLEEGVEGVVNADKLSVARNFAERTQERRKAASLLSVASAGQTAAEPTSEPVVPGIPTPAKMVVTPDRAATIECVNFSLWSREVRKTPYNLVHCDFPYGVNAGDAGGQSSRGELGGYEDEPEIYFDLLTTLVKNQDNFIGPSAHMLFWFSMDFYQQTVDILAGAGWRVDKFPFIWFKSDNTGIIPDANRGPRRIYETALFCTRGDRKIVRAVGNCVGAPSTKEYHMSEKSYPMLQHFFRMLVDDTTVFLDPTCGSGNSVKAAEEAGCRIATGLEINPEYAERAKENLGL